MNALPHDLPANAFKSISFLDHGMGIFYIQDILRLDQPGHYKSDELPSRHAQGRAQVYIEAKVIHSGNQPVKGKMKGID
jgi:hypothetical protein